jgi:pyrroloquinoline quinone (PQQ) biosynthesis protein C
VRRRTIDTTDHLLREIDHLVADRHIKEHPLVDEIRSGAASREAIRGFLVHFYQIGPRPSPRADCAIYGRCPEDPDIHHLLFEDVVLEEGAGTVSGTARHLDVFLEHAKAFGITREELDTADPIPECKAFVHWRYHLAYKGDWLGAICGIAFIEAASAARNDLILDGLIRHYGFERGRPDLLFWELHASEIEEGHGTIGPTVVRRYANDAHVRKDVLEAVRTSIDLQWLAFDGMHRAFFLDDPRYERWRSSPSVVNGA